MATHTRGAGAARLVMVMRRGVILALQVASGAKSIALRAQLSTMGIMAVATRNPACVHLALQKRSPVVNLVVLLSVGMVEPTR